MSRIQHRGFTIVELLIVIVVIGILAGISIVAYNGMQDRAREAKMSAAIDAYEKTLLIYKSTYKQFPSTSANAHCLGREEDYPEKDGFEAGVCYTLSMGNAPPFQKERVVHDFNVELAKVTSGSLPNGSYPAYSFNSDDGVHMRMRGVLAIPQSYGVMELVYFTGDNGQDCLGRLEKQSSEGIVICSLMLR